MITSKNKNVKRDISDIQENLTNHINFLKSDIEKFDRGDRKQALRMAVSLRTILYNSPANVKSKSLVKQLNLENNMFLSTCIPIHNPQAGQPGFSGLVFFKVSNDSQTQSVPILDGFTKKMLSYDDYLSESIFRANYNNELLDFTRRDIINFIANQEGGAHVDAELDEKYFNLTRKNALGLIRYNSDGNTTEAINDIHLVAIRQIAHELLKSLDSDYETPIEKEKTNGIIVGGLQVIYSDDTKAGPGEVVIGGNGLNTKSIGRNDPCPCGSGKKFKKCHGENA